jgi:hypothetical protein
MILSALMAVALAAGQPTLSSQMSYAILDIANEKGEITALSSFIGDDLSLRYASDSGYSLVERGQLKKVLKEHNLQATGVMDEASISSLGKFLGTSRIITGQYYQMGDDYVVMIRVLDVATGKVHKMAKVNFPKSSSTQALAQTIIMASSTEQVVRPGMQISELKEGEQGPLSLERCKASAWDGAVTCFGTLISASTGRLDISPDQELFFMDDGIMSKYLGFSIAGTKGNFEVPKGLKVPVEIKLSGIGKRFRDFHLKYSFGNKDYLIEGARPIE